MKKILLLIGSIIIVLLVLELAIRILYKDLPDKYISIFDTFYQSSDDKYLVYEHISDWKGYATGIYVNINDLGLRNPPLSSNNSAKRILLIGDSMMFGFGLRENYLISVQLEKILNKKLYGEYEVINAGVCGYNLIQNFARLKQIYDIVKPDYVLFTFIHNDIEGLHYSNGITKPIFQSAFFPKINRESNKFKLYNFLINEDIYKHPIYRKGLRYFLINNSRLYLYIALKIKNILINETGGEIPNPYITYFPESSTVEEIVFKPLNDKLEEIQLWLDLKELDYSFVVLNSHQMGSKFELLFLDILENNNINYFVFNPFLGDIRKKMLGWDPHPNRIGAKHYAELFFDNLIMNGFISTNYFFHFNKAIYNYNFNLHKNKLETDIIKDNREGIHFQLKEKIEFAKYTDYSYYPVWGIYNNNLPDLDFENGKVVSNYFSIILHNDSKDKLYITGRKIINDNIKAEIYLNNKLFNINIVSEEFIIELNLRDLNSDTLEIFMNSKNYNYHKGNPVTFVLKEIWFE